MEELWTFEVSRALLKRGLGEKKREEKERP
jgi:hypothetical protein